MTVQGSVTYDTYDLVIVDDPAPGVRRITLNRPEKRNALNHPLRGQRLPVVCIRHGESPDAIVRLPDGSHAAVALSATTSSGFSSVCGFLPRALSSNKSSTSARTAGIRVDPPTSTTSSICAAVSPASFSACLQGPAVRPITPAVNSSYCARVISRR